MSGHTPTPWHVVPETLGSIRAGNGTDVAQCHQTRPVNGPADHAERLANAEHIVRCVNSHDDLVKVLERIDPGPDWETPEDATDGQAFCEITVGDIKAIRAALAKAKP